MVSMDGESDTATPYGAERERIGDVRDGVTIDQQQVSAGSREDTASVGESETACGSGGSSSKRLDGCQSSRDEQLQFVMHAGAVGEAAEVGYGNRHIGSSQNVHTGLVQGGYGGENVVEVALREGVEAAPQGVEPGLAQFGTEAFISGEVRCRVAHDRGVEHQSE